MKYIQAYTTGIIYLYILRYTSMPILIQSVRIPDEPASHYGKAALLPSLKDNMRPRLFVRFG